MASNKGPFARLPLEYLRDELDPPVDAAEREGSGFMTLRTQFAP